jgi:hypothetical protein
MIRQILCGIIAARGRTATVSTQNGPVHGEQPGASRFQVRSLFEQPDRVADEYRRRIVLAHDGAAIPDEIVRLNK